MPIKDYLIKNYEDKTIGKELSPYIEGGLDMLGGAWDDTMWKARRGMLGPHALIGSHGIDFLGKVIPDIPVDKGISHVLHEYGGLDKPIADLGGVGGELLLTRKLLKKVSKIKPKDLGITTTYEKITPLSSAIDEVVTASPTVIKNAKRIYSESPQGGLGGALTKAKIPPVTTGHMDLVLSAEQLGLQGVPGFTGEPYALQSSKKGDQSPKEYSNEFFNQKFDEMGLTDDVKFSLKHMLDSKEMTKYVRRTRKMGIGNPNYSLSDYIKTRKLLVDEFLNGLEAFDIDPSEIEAHHIASLRQVAQLFEGLERHEFPDMIKLIYKHGIFTGNDPNNLVAIPKIGHISDKRYPNIRAVHDYLNKELGLYNEQIAGDWGVLVRDLSVQEREDFVKRFAAVVKGSQSVYEQAIRDSLDEFALRQSGYEDVDGNIFDEGGQEAMLDAGRDISEADAKLAKERIAEYFKLQLTEPNYEALLDSIFGGDSAGEAMRRRGIKPGQPVQGQLIDLGRKPPRKPPRKTTKKDNEYPSGPGAYWDIESE